MSLKNSIEMVKEELSSEEKFFEKAVITERFFKKYKKALIVAVALFTLGVIGSVTYTEMEKARIADANALLAKLITAKEASKADPAALARLNSLSTELHDVWLYSQAITSKESAVLEQLLKSKASFVADFSAYEIAQNSNDLHQLELYTQRTEAIYADLAKIQAALLLMQTGDIKTAHEKLRTISVDSALSETAAALLHYGVK